MGRDVDPYMTLGLDHDASMDEVKKAYKELARKWHPDKNPNDKSLAEKKFKEISEAYRILSDGETRQNYDMDEEMKQFRKGMREKRKHEEKIRRMAREQEEYVRKQEARRARAHSSPEADYFLFGNHDSLFNDFFSDREEWRRIVPNLFGRENHFGHIFRDMNEMMKSAFETTRNPHAGYRRHRSEEFTYQPRSSETMDDVFNAFFSNSGSTHSAGFSY